MNNLHRHPDIETIVRELPDAGESVHAACCTLARNPTAGGAEQLATTLNGMERLVMALSYALSAQECQL